MISPRIKLSLGTLALSLLSALSTCTALSGATFNELQIGEQPLNFYNGGFGSLGTGPGPNAGLSFSPDFVTIDDGVIFPSSNVLKSARLTSNSGIMNVFGGYSGIFSFYYTAHQSANLQLYSGLNGAGNLVGASLLPAGRWFPGAGSAGSFQSVVFTGAGLEIDNVTFGALVLPEPVTTMLFFTGSALLLAWAGLKRLKTQL